MREEYLHYLFETRTLGSQFTTTNNQSLSIIDFGTLNSNSGPDFLGAKIRLDGIIWVGHIEFHLKASDWFAHKHQMDPSYENVIAHFVYEANKDVKSGEYLLPTVELKDFVGSADIDRLQRMNMKGSWIPCESQIASVSESVVSGQLEWLILNRLQRKSQQIAHDLKQSKHSKSLMFFRQLAPYFGGTVNKSAFETLIGKIKPHQLIRLNGNSLKMEALLFGLSGLLPDTSDEPYVLQLRSIFEKLKEESELHPMNIVEWKYSRMHPPAQPPIRIAQLAALLASSLEIATLLRITEPNELFQAFQNSPSDYWNTHYRFGSKTKKHSSRLSQEFAERLIINGIIPVKYAIGRVKSDQSMIKEAVNLLTKLRAEQNSVVHKWSAIGLQAENAMDSQALLELKTQCCDQKKCLSCDLGKSLIFG